MGPKNDVHYGEVSATWRFCYESLTVISIAPEKSARCGELSAIKDVRYKEVSLYLLKSPLSHRLTLRVTTTLYNISSYRLEQ